jgi:membrane-associated phospholipid phosphatase
MLSHFKICRPTMLGLILVSLFPSLGLSANEAKLLQEWNRAFLNAILQDSLAPGIASRKMATAYAAMFDAVNSLNPQYRSYLKFEENSVPKDLSPTQVAIGAAFRVAELEYPAQTGTFRNLMQRQLIQLGGADLPSLDYGKRIANKMIEKRANDGSSHSITYYPRNEIGFWKRTPPKYRPPETPQWINVLPFCVTDTMSVRVDGPPPLTSNEYAEAWKQIKTYGSKNSSIRTDDQTEIAYFWSCFSYTATPAGHWNEIASRLLDEKNIPLLESLRLMSLMNLAMADAGIYAWKVKYQHHFWRPIHAIRLADKDGNSQTTSEPDWDSLLEAPPHPEYVSGHSTYTGAGAEVLRRFFQDDNIPFAATSDSLPGVTRSYKSISACEMEIGMSRIYGGIHFIFSNLDGLDLGHQIGQQVFQNFLRPLDLE